MFVDGRSLDDTVLVTDVCIIGAGPAGITIASELLGSGVSVTVLEAGSEYHDRHESREIAHSVKDHARGAQSAARGSNVGEPYFPLRLSRARGIGGSTAALKEHGLRSRPLDPVDFNGRGRDRWPLEYEELGTRLAAASTYCGIPDVGEWWEEPAAGQLFPSGHPVVDTSFRHGNREAFATRASEIASGDVQRWIINAVATTMAVDQSGTVTSIRVATGPDTGFSVEASTVVLASGGIDNARTLLNNESLLEHLGAAADNVGRNFMEHMHYVAGHIVPRSETAKDALTERYCDIGEERWITLSDDVVGAERLARSAFLPVPAYLGSLAPGVNALGRLMRAVPYGPFDKGLWRSEMKAIWRDKSDIPASFRERLGKDDRQCFAVSAMSEQTPNRDSAISLSDATDRFGLRLPVLNWDIAERDWADARRSTDELATALDGADLGDFVPSWPTDRSGPAAFTGGWHHMGTTRMSVDPEHGVVDTDLRVHGTGNLYVAGSSVFPTGGFANPTLSLVALSIRLAEHLTSTVRP